MTWMSSVASNILLALPLALIAWGIQHWGRRYALARMLWLVVLLKLVTPPLLFFSFNETSASPACRNGTCGCPQHARSPAGDSFGAGLLAVWGIGVAATAWTAWRRWTHFEKLLSHAEPAPPEWQAAARQLSNELHLGRCPAVLAVPGQVPPMVVPTWGKLRLVVPRELVGRLGESQRSVLLLHELTHIHRRDHWVRLLELFVRVAFWWLPVVGFISRQIRVCEEICCDAAVVSRRPESRRDYASLLLDVIDLVTPLSCSAQHATGMNPVDDFERRIRTILHGTCENRRSWPIVWIAALLALGVVPWGFEYDWSMRSSAEATVRDVDTRLLELNGSESCAPAETPAAIRDFSSLCCPS